MRRRVPAAARRGTRSRPVPCAPCAAGPRAAGHRPRAAPGCTARGRQRRPGLPAGGTGSGPRPGSGSPSPVTASTATGTPCRASALTAATARPDAATVPRVTSTTGRLPVRNRPRPWPGGLTTPMSRPAAAGPPASSPRRRRARRRARSRRAAHAAAGRAAGRERAGPQPFPDTRSLPFRCRDAMRPVPAASPQPGAWWRQHQLHHIKMMVCSFGQQPELNLARSICVPRGMLSTQSKAARASC